MRNYFIYILLTLSIIACSANLETNEKDEYTDYTGRIGSRNLAMEHFIDGSIAEMKGKVAEAILEYQEAVRLDPSPGIYYSLGKAYFRLNKLSQALQNARTAVRLDSNDVEFNTLLAKVYSSARLADSAAVVYHRILELDSNNIGAYYNLGLIYEESRPSQALEIYKKVLSITGPEWSILVKIADLNERLGNVDETIETFEELLALNPSSLELQKLLIESYIKTEKYEHALKMTDEALTLFPDDLNLIEFRANALIKMGKWEEGSEEYMKIIRNKEVPFDSKGRIAAAFLNEAVQDTTLIPIAKKIFEEISKDSTDWQINVYLGEIAIQQNNDSLAIEYFKTASDLAAWNNNIWVRLGGLLFEGGKYEEAVQEMEKAVKSFPDDFVINFILGLSYSQQQNHELAEPYLKRAVELNSSNQDALSAYGFTLYQLQQNDEALEYLNKALDVNPSNVQILGMVGMIYDAKEMWEECDKSYELALSIDSTDALVLNNYAYSLAERGIQLERALEMSKKSIEADPDNPSYLDTIGWIYYKLGDYNQAKENIEKAISFDKDNAVLLDHLGDVFFKLGDTAKAIELWKESFDLDDSQESVKQKIDAKGLL